MTKSNRDRVGEVMDALREGLGPFVLREYKQYHKDSRYLQEIDRTLNSSTYSAPHLPDEAAALTKVDVHGWLNLMVRQWNDVFRTRLGKAERSFVGELQEARNNWAHQKAFSNDDVERIADTATRLLEAVGAVKEAEITRNTRNEVRRLYEADRQQAKTLAGTPPDELPTAGQVGVPQPIRETIGVRILRAVAILVFQEGKTTFTPTQIRHKIGVESQQWYRSYIQHIRAMSDDRSRGAPSIRSSFQGVLTRVARGEYKLTEYGKRLLLAEFKTDSRVRETESTVSELEQQFHKAMIQVYENAKRYCHYNATYFLQMVSERGGLATARYLITSDKPSDGFTRLWECRRLDLTVEAVALNPTYAALFTQEELKLAKERLQQYGYETQ